AVDGSPAMLAWGRVLAERDPDLSRRVQFLEGFLPRASIPVQAYTAVISNSLLHHLPDPQVLWQSIQQYAQTGTQVFVMDLRRPESEARARELLKENAADAPLILQRDFYHSLLAAFEPAEVEHQLRQAGLAELQVKIVSNRHLFVWGVKR
ncbi:MAG: class I SAM-dependent methyltransferase, partial [Anaerolineales bacterium]|nr:class I SAM-dependent methyltransferase [Anaerolineales bacterium]